MGRELNVGGRISFTFDGEVWHVAGEGVTVDEGGIEAQAVQNADGSIGRAVKAGMVKVELKLRPSKGQDVNRLMQGTFNFSMFEEDMDRTLLMTGAFMEGRPKRNTENGEVSGMTAVCSSAAARYI